MDTWTERREASLSDSGFSRYSGQVDQQAQDPPSALFAAVFEQLPYGIMIVKPNGQVLHANKMAVAAINGNDIWIDPEQRLVTLRPADALALHRALVAAAGLRSTLIVLGTGNRCLAVAVQPLLGPNPAHRAPHVVLLPGKSAFCDANGIGAFGRLHGLTPAETTVLDILRDGPRAKGVALRLHCSIATVRSHLRSIYHKTGARDLHELMARLAALPPLEPAMA